MVDKKFIITILNFENKPVMKKSPGISQNISLNQKFIFFIYNRMKKNKYPFDWWSNSLIKTKGAH